MASAGERRIFPFRRGPRSSLRVLHATLHIFLLSRTLRLFVSSPGCGQDSTQTSPERRGSTWHPERESRHRPSVLHCSSKRLGWKGWARRLAYHFIFMGGLVDPQLRASNFIDRLIGSGQVVLHCAHHHPLQPGEQRVPQHILIVRVLRARRAVWLLPISFPFCEHRGLTRPPASPFASRGHLFGLPWKGSGTCLAGAGGAEALSPATPHHRP